MPALHGVGVLVTRPEQQAEELCRLLEAHGAVTRRLPALQISAVGDRAVLAESIGGLEDYALIVFTSANAVRFGAALLGGGPNPPLAAIGPATARALHLAGYTVAVQPRAAFDSEGLLADPELEQVSGRRVLIVKGADGRRLLQQELVRRGALVTCADVYARTPTRPEATELDAVLRSFSTGELQFVTATSVDVADRLLDMAGTSLRAAFERARWLVPSRRIAVALAERGLPAPVLLAKSADDQDLVDALLHWRSGASDA